MVVVVVVTEEKEGGVGSCYHKRLILQVCWSCTSGREGRWWRLLS